jgi:DNA mismatch repair protein MutL
VTPERAPAKRGVRVLPDDLANQIAAGEVVERPSSVVKELVENAFDAGGRRVRIDIEAGGIGLVRVTDDGVGMSLEDARMAPLRHATSKIRELDDLRAIGSFGFRGEALPSIASVSRFSLRTRTRDDHEGTEVVIEGGGPMRLAPCGVAVGTSVEVRDLFFNVPARRKFLRAVGTESAHVTEVAEAAALAEPGVTVTLARDGRVVREWLRASDREERVRAAFEGEALAACRGQRGPLVVEAFVSRPERARNGAVGLSIFVNGRHVRDRSLARAIAHAYGSVLEPGRYPVGVVYLDLPPELVDVNVHPQKAEVRFADGRAVADALYKVVAGELSRAFGLPPPAHGRFGDRKQKLFAEDPGATLQAWAYSTEGRSPAPPYPIDDPPTGDGVLIDAPPTLPSITPRTSASPPERDAKESASPPVAPTPVPYPNAAEIARAPERPVVFGALRFLAQSRQTYLICEGETGLFILDQHAAAERVTFDRLRRAFHARDVATQRLLFPVVVSVSAAEVALVEEAHADALRAGLDVRPAGATEVAVHAVPRVLARAAPERLVRDLLGELGRSGERAYSGAIDLALATMACHGSVRAGDPVSAEEAAALLRALDEVDFAGHCPHGRPIVMRVGWGELDHRVGRR